MLLALGLKNWDFGKIYFRWQPSLEIRVRLGAAGREALTHAPLKRNVCSSQRELCGKGR